MRIIPLSILIGLTLSFAQAPTFENPVYLTAGGVNINVGYFGSPFMYDWDGDLKKDLITGQFTSGNVRLYANTGEHYDPSFTTFSFILAGGIPIVLPYG